MAPRRLLLVLKRRRSPMRAVKADCPHRDEALRIRRGRWHLCCAEPVFRWWVVVVIRKGMAMKLTTIAFAAVLAASGTLCARRSAYRPEFRNRRSRGKLGHARYVADLGELDGAETAQKRRGRV